MSAFFRLFALLSLAVRPLGEGQASPRTILNEAGEQRDHSDIPVLVRLDNVAIVNVTTKVGPAAIAKEVDVRSGIGERAYYR